MPKVVDHEQRRRELAEAVWRVVLRDGIEGVSVRDVAEEAGCSSGALRHYFSTKEELLAGAAELVVERVIGRLKRGPQGKTPHEAVRLILCEVLPLDEDRSIEASVWLAFAARSLVDQRIAIEHGMVFDGIRELCSRITDQLSSSGHLVPGLDPEKEAGRLHALVDGLCIHALMGKLDNEQTLGILDAHLEHIIYKDPADAQARFKLPLTESSDGDDY